MDERVEEVREEGPQRFIAKSTPVDALERTRLQRFKDFVTACKRVLRVTKKPNREEFKGIVKISGAGILIIGAMGFLVSIVKDFFF